MGSQNVSSNVSCVGSASRDTVFCRLVDQQLVAERRGKCSTMPADRYAMATSQYSPQPLSVEICQCLVMARASATMEGSGCL